MNSSTKRRKVLFDPLSNKPFKISRSKIDLFLECPLCFYLDRRLGVSRPPGPPFTLNVAVDHLLKKEFDIHRAKGTKHPLMKEYGIDAVPFAHDDINIWRENFYGVQVHHEPTNLVITGAVDDVWITPKKELIVVDYKATAKDSEVNIDADWQISYKRQMEVYQWLLRGRGFKVLPTGYFVYVNGRKDREAFDGKLEFDVKVIPYTGSDKWVDKTLRDIAGCLKKESFPPKTEDCEFCEYRYKAGTALAEAKKAKTLKNKSLFE